MQNETKKTIRYFSMFSGVGGFERGFERAKDLSKRQGLQQRGDEIDLPDNKQESFPTKQFSCVGFSEIDKYSIQTYQKNFPDHINFGDATKIKPEELPDFDMLCGGFPCQAFSIAGKRRGFQDTRGTMFFEIARILKIKRPKIVFLENVKGLLNHEKGETFKVILQALDELGYEVQWMVLNSKFFGVPQNRERVFIIGSLRGSSRPEILPFGEGSQDVNKESFQGIPTSQSLRAGYYKGGQGTHIREPKMLGYLQVEGERRVNDCPLEINQFLKDNKGSFTIKEISEKIDENLGKVEHYFRTDKSRAIPKPDVWLKLQQVLDFPDTYNKQVSELERFFGDVEQTRRVYSEEMSPTLNSTQPNFHAITQINQSKESGGKQPYQQNRIYDKKGLSPALPSELGGDRSHLINTMKIRRLTPTECERLQGFPDGWTEGVSDTQRYKQMGNAVTVNVIRAIAEKLGS